MSLMLRVASIFAATLIVVSAFSVSASATAKPVLTVPMTGADVARSKQARQDARDKYDKIQDDLIAAELADEKALADFRASLGSEEQAFETLKSNRNAAKLEYEAAQQAHDDARARYQLLRSRRGKDQTDESIAAIADFQLAEAEEARAKSFFEKADQRLIQTAIPGPNSAMLAWIESQAKLRNAQALFNLTETQYLLAHRRHVNILLANPPPFLRDVTIFSGQQKLYQAEWVKDPANQVDISETYVALSDLQPRLTAAVKDLDTYLDEQADIRIDLGEKMRALDPAIARDAAEYGNAKWWAVMGPAIVEGVAVGIDVFTTGGTATAAGKASELAMDKYLAAPGRQAVARLAGSAAARSYAKASSRVISSGIGAGVGKGFVGTIMGAATDDRGNNSLTAPLESEIFTGADILFSDGAEILASSVAPDDATLLRTSQAVVRKGWDNKTALRALAGRTLNWKNFRSNLKVPAPATVIESVVKVAVKRYFEGKATAADRRMMQRIAEATALNITFNRMRQDNREIIEVRKQHHIILESLYARLSRAGTPLKLNVLVDKKATDRQLREPLRVQLTFSQPLSVPPSALFAGTFLSDFKPAAGGRNVWNTRIQRDNVKNEKKWPLVVMLGQDNQPFSNVDGKPQTAPEFDFVKSQWTDSELLPDLNHRLLLYASLFDLTGYWRSAGSSGPREVFIQHVGDQLTATHTIADRFSHAIGDPDFNGTLAGDSISGRFLARLPPPHYSRCPQDSWVPFSAVLNAERSEIRMAIKSSSINVATCRKIGPASAVDTYTRLLDADGNPIRKMRE